MTATSIGDSYALCLCGGWHLTYAGRPIPVHGREQRVLSLLALQGASERRYVAGTLWAEHSEEQALASLRASVWHLRSAAPGLLSITGPTLDLDAATVDLHDIRHSARAAIENPATVDADSIMFLLARAELLPGWDEDWILYERERLHQLRLQALESLAHEALGRGDAYGAIAAAGAAAHLEPLRESPRRLLIAAHLAIGNHADAFREYLDFGRALRQEMGITPSDQMAALVRTMRIPSHAPPQQRQASTPLEMGSTLGL